MTIQKTSFEEIQDLPKIVYKYRDWSNSVHQEIISNLSVFMARPSSFEDHLDCKLEEDYEKLTDKEIYNKFYQDSLVKFPFRTQQQHSAFAEYWLQNTPIRDPIQLAQVKQIFMNKFDDQFGVLSLTANNKSKKMWKKYANNNTGFCVGFNSIKLFEFVGGGGKVNYYDNLPEIPVFANFMEKASINIFSKEQKWEFEEEYRTHKFWEYFANDNQRKIKLSKDCYSEIIFGSEMLEVNKSQIESICNSTKLNVKFKECIIEGNEIEIKEWFSR